MSTEIAVATSAEVGGFVRFANIADAVKFADYISKSDLVPKAYQGKPADIVIAMQMGMEVGFSPMQALQAIAVIGGRPSVWGDAIPALILPHPDCLSFEEILPDGPDDTKWVATCVIERRGKPTVSRSYAQADAKKAGLWGKAGPWTTNPKRMLQMRARAFAARDSFPDVLRGISVAEESQDIPVAPRVTMPRRIEPTSEPVVSDPDVPAPATVKGDLTMTKLCVNDSVCLKDDRGLYYRFITNDGDFYTRDEATATALMSIHGEERTFTATYRQAKVESGDPVRALVRVELDPVVDPPDPEAA